MGRKRRRMTAAVAACIALAACALSLAAPARALADAPGTVTVEGREHFITDGVGFGRGKTADGTVMYCADAQKHYPDNGTALTRKRAAGNVIDYLLYYGWGGQGDTHAHSYEATQQAVGRNGRPLARRCTISGHFLSL